MRPKNVHRDDCGRCTLANVEDPLQSNPRLLGGSKDNKSSKAAKNSGCLATLAMNTIETRNVKAEHEHFLDQSRAFKTTSLACLDVRPSSFNT